MNDNDADEILILMQMMLFQFLAFWFVLVLRDDWIFSFFLFHFFFSNSETPRRAWHAFTARGTFCEKDTKPA